MFHRNSSRITTTIECQLFHDKLLILPTSDRFSLKCPITVSTIIISVAGVDNDHNQVFNFTLIAIGQNEEIQC